jgi:hypothetical protein
MEQPGSPIEALTGKRASPESGDEKTTGRWKKWEHQKFLEGICFVLSSSVGIIWKTLAIGREACGNKNWSTSSQSRTKILHEN